MTIDISNLWPLVLSLEKWFEERIFNTKGKHEKILLSFLNMLKVISKNRNPFYVNRESIFLESINVWAKLFKSISKCIFFKNILEKN